ASLGGAGGREPGGAPLRLQRESTPYAPGVWRKDARTDAGGGDLSPRGGRSGAAGPGGGARDHYREGAARSGRPLRRTRRGRSSWGRGGDGERGGRGGDR